MTKKSNFFGSRAPEGIEGGGLMEVFSDQPWGESAEVTDARVIKFATALANAGPLEITQDFDTATEGISEGRLVILARPLTKDEIAQLLS